MPHPNINYIIDIDSTGPHFGWEHRYNHEYCRLIKFLIATWPISPLTSSKVEKNIHGKVMEHTWKTHGKPMEFHHINLVDTMP